MAIATSGFAARIYGSDAERVWPRVKPGTPDECWLWQGPIGKRGYPTTLGLGRREDGSRIVATPAQLAWRTTIGPIPAEMTIDHLCRTPRCCNPHHLELVTRVENTRRRDIPTRFPAVNPPMPFPIVTVVGRTSCKRGHDFAELGWYTNGEGKRTCAECRRIGKRKPGAVRQGDKTHCPQQHPYDETSIVRRSNGRVERQCRICDRARQRVAAANRKAA